MHALYYKLGVLNNYCSYPNHAFIYVMNVCGHVVNSNPLSSQKFVIYVFITCVFKAKTLKAQQIKRSYMNFLCHFFC